MLNAVDQFKARVLKLEFGEEYVYFRGDLATQRAKFPVLDQVGVLAHGLQLVGAAQLTQKRFKGYDTEYRLRVTRPVRNVDFERGRELYIKSLKDEEAA